MYDRVSGQGRELLEGELCLSTGCPLFPLDSSWATSPPRVCVCRCAELSPEADESSSGTEGGLSSGRAFPRILCSAPLDRPPWPPLDQALWPREGDVALDQLPT